MRRVSGVTVVEKVLVLALCLTLGSGAAFAMGRWNGGPSQGAIGPYGPGAGVALLPYEDLSANETAGLLHMVEEEKLARDVYLYLAQIWPDSIFDRIAQAEQIHMDAVATLLAKYGLANPVEDLAEGQFYSSEFQELYDGLISSGSQGWTEALHVGATIEELDIADLMALSAQADNQDILTVYSNIQQGSVHHLNAFVRNIELAGATYTAQFLTDDELAALLNTWVAPRGNGYWNQGSTGAAPAQPGGGYMGYRGIYFVDENGDEVCDYIQ